MDHAKDREKKERGGIFIFILVMERRDFDVTFQQEQKGPVKIAYLTKDCIQQDCLRY